MSPEVTLRRAVRADIAAIMAIERRPGFESLISRSSLGEHEAMLASPEYAYFVGLDARDAVVAFAILRDLEDRYGNLYLKRIAVFEPGAGVGFGVHDRARELGVPGDRRAPLLAQHFQQQREGATRL